MKIKIIKCNDSNNFFIINKEFGYLFNPREGLIGDEFSYADIREILTADERELFEEGQKEFDVHVQNIIAFQQNNSDKGVMFIKHNIGKK